MTIAVVIPEGQKFACYIDGAKIGVSKHQDYFEYHRKSRDVKYINDSNITEFVYREEFEPKPEAEQWFKLTGKLVYEPNREIKQNGKVKAFKKAAYKSKTMIIELRHDGLTDLYRWFVKRKFGVDLQPPMYGAHVTIIRGNERVKNQAAWKKHAGKSIDIWVSPEISKTWKFWTIPVKKTPELDALRIELGNGEYHDYHITIGREFEADDIPTPRPEKIVPFHQLKTCN